VVNSNLAYQEIEVEVPQIKDDPVKWCSVSLSDVIARGKRLEASVFDVEAIKAYETLTTGKYPADLS
jgi:type I restriction enzyme S subunit